MVMELLAGLVSLIIVLFIPGYFVTLAFFPKRDEIDSIERITFSFVFSITFLPLLVLIENQVLSIPINLYSIAGTFALIVVASFLFYLSRIGILPLPGICQKMFPAVPREQAMPLIPKLRK